MSEYTHVYTWRNTPERKMIYGRKCRVVAQRPEGKIIIEFEGGERLKTDARAVRRVDAAPPPPPAEKRYGCEYCWGKFKYMPGSLGRYPCLECGGTHAVCRDCQVAPRVARGVLPEVVVSVKRCPEPR